MEIFLLTIIVLELAVLIAPEEFRKRLPPCAPPGSCLPKKGIRITRRPDLTPSQPPAADRPRIRITRRTPPQPRQG